MEMENLFKIAKNSLCVVIFAMACNVFSQDDYYVYKFDGIPYLEVNDSIKPITKGMAIKKESMLTLTDSDVIRFINKDGDEYLIDEAGNYNYNTLFEFSKKTNTNSFAKKYLTYLWKQYTNSVVDTRSKSGVVYRGDGVLLMQYPVDSAKVIGTEVSFKWFKKKDKEKNYYLILKDVETNKETIIGTPAISLTLMVDEHLLKSGRNYEWAVTETKYPTEDETKFYSFSVMKESEFKILSKEMKTIMAYLKQQGLNRLEIQQTLCEVYKICY